MAATTTPIARSWRRRIETGLLTRGDTLALTSHVWSKAHGGHKGKRTNLTRIEAQEILRDVIGLKTDHDLTDRGLDWIHRYGAKLGIEADVIEYACGFELVDVRNVAEDIVVPVWRILSPPSSAWCYWRIPWQAVEYSRYYDGPTQSAWTTS